MKYLPPIFLLLLLSCGPSNQPQVFHAQTAEVSPETPDRDLDLRLRLSPAGALEQWTAEGWKSLPATGLPTHIVWPELTTPVATPFQAFSEGAGNFLGVTTTREVFLSGDKGTTWTRILHKDTLERGAYLTTLALDPLNPKRILVGTSFSGLYQTQDQGKTWTELSSLLHKQAPGADYWEIFHSLAFSKAVPDQVYASLGIKGEIMLLNLKDRTASLLATVPQGETAEVLWPRLKEGTESLEVKTPTAYWRLDLKTLEWTSLGHRAPSEPWSPEKAARMAKSANRYAHYVSGNQAASPTLLDNHLAFMKQRGLNALVVDFKDDSGLVLWDSKVETALKADAVRPRLPLDSILKKVHEAGFYLIARFVVFKDEKLYRYQNFKYALWDATTKKPWGHFRETTDETTGEKTYVQKEFWVDVYSQDVWDYNIALAQELQTLGVDEIQFDYIRFPSDGPVGRITNRFALRGMNKADALESFLKKARQAISIPLSIDIFGFNGFFPMEHLGQNAPMISHYVDVISPMFYPSHFSTDFFGKDPYLDRAKRIYYEGNLRSRQMTGGRVHIRPWVQAFLLGPERNYTRPQYTGYLKNQLEGSQAGGGNGWLLWNAANNYYMVNESLTPFQEPQSLD